MPWLRVVYRRAGPHSARIRSRPRPCPKTPASPSSTSQPNEEAFPSAPENEPRPIIPFSVCVGSLIACRSAPADRRSEVRTASGGCALQPAQRPAATLAGGAAHLAPCAPLPPRTAHHSSMVCRLAAPSLMALHQDARQKGRWWHSRRATPVTCSVSRSGQARSAAASSPARRASLRRAACLTWRGGVAGDQCCRRAVLPGALNAGAAHRGRLFR
jgi:hypothetical protein